MAQGAVTFKTIPTGTQFATSATQVCQIPLSKAGIAFAFVPKGRFKPLAFTISGSCSSSRKYIFKSKLISFGSYSPSPTPSPLSKCQSRRKTVRVMDAPGSACQCFPCARGVIYCTARVVSSLVALTAALEFGAWQAEAAHRSAREQVGLWRSLGKAAQRAKR